MHLRQPKVPVQMRCTSQYIIIKLIATLVQDWYLKAFLFNSSCPSNKWVFKDFLNFSVSSSDLKATGSAFQSLGPLYANNLFPYLVLNVGVSSSNQSSGRPLNCLYDIFTLSGHFPRIALWTINRILKVTRVSTFSQCNSLSALVAELSEACK